MIIPVAIVAVFISVLIALVMRRRKSRHLKRRFGPEYDRAVFEHGDSRRAEVTLTNRERRVNAFRLRPLSAIERQAYWTEWMAVQRSFVDNPSAALGMAERLIIRAMSDRGYPESDFEQRAEDISVSYPAVVQNYRAAHEIVAHYGDGNVATEELRQVMVHYRSLFDELLEPDKDEFPDPAWDELYAPPNDELLKPAKGKLLEAAKDELLEPAKLEEIDGKRKKATRERAS